MKDIKRRILGLRETSHRVLAMAIVGGVLGVFIAVATKVIPKHLYYDPWWSRTLINIFTMRAVILGGTIGGIYRLIFFPYFPFLWFFAIGALCWSFVEVHGIVYGILAGGTMSFLPFLYKREWDSYRTNLL